MKRLFVAVPINFPFGKDMVHFRKGKFMVPKIGHVTFESSMAYFEVYTLNRMWKLDNTFEAIYFSATYN
jgi:hypothetical protein